MGEEENKATARMFYEEVVNRGNIGVIDKVTAENYVDHTAAPGMPPGRGGEEQGVLKLRGARHPREVSVPTRSVRLHPGGEGQPRRDPPGTRVRPGAEPRKGAGPRGARARGRVGSSRDRAGGPTRPVARVPGVPNPRLRPGGHVSDPEVRPAGGDRRGGTSRVGVGRLRNPHGRAARDGPPA